MGFRIMRVPELELTTSSKVFSRVLTLDPHAFQTLPTDPRHEPLAYLSFGFEEDGVPPMMNIRFPRTSHSTIGTPLLFDVFLRKGR